MASINKAILIGNLGRDPELSYTPGGLAVARFSIATSEQWKDKETGDKKERTEWHRIVAFGKLAEICGEYLAKGKSVYIEGRLQTNSYEKDGVTRYSTDIIASQMQMLGSKDSGNEYRPSANAQTSPAPEPSVPGMAQQTGDDDIPF
jgi:single-strand DNA-binding protein